MTSNELSMAPGRTLATMFLTTASDDDVTDDDVTMADNDAGGRAPPSVSRSEALMMTPDDEGDEAVGDDRGRGTVANLTNNDTAAVKMLQSSAYKVPTCT